MNEFNRAFETVVGIEGGYVFDEDDAGGETKFGISKRSYPHLNIKDITLEQAKIIYYRDFWNTQAMNLDNFKYDIALELFDTGVNMSMEVSRKFLQEALSLLNRVETKFPDLVIDGIIGKKTMEALVMVDYEELLKVLNGLQFMRYYTIVQHKHSQEKFFAGWVKRT